MRGVAAALLCLGLSATGAQAQVASRQAAMADGVRACRKWVLEPALWARDELGFAARAGLAGKLVRIDRLPAELLPPGLIASANRFWRIGAGPGAGLFVAASTTTPICSVAGGGSADLQPAAQAFVAAVARDPAWTTVGHRTASDMILSSFRASADAKAALVVSRASKPGQRTDRVQFLATIAYRIRK